MEEPPQDAVMRLDVREPCLMTDTEIVEAGEWRIINEAQSAVLYGDADLIDV
jgi:hypothetical protein